MAILNSLHPIFTARSADIFPPSQGEGFEGGGGSLSSPVIVTLIRHLAGVAARHGGFTLVEMMVVLAVIAILALMTIPSFQDQIARDQITTALPLVDIAKAPVAASWAALQAFPADNAAAGLPAADKIVNNQISSVRVDNGALHITFGNRANALLNGKILTIRPAVVADAPIVPVAWVCGYAEAPGKMTVQGENRTSVPANFLPFACRARGPQGGK